MASKLPADDWTLVSNGQSWRQFAASGADIIEAKQELDANAGNAGVSLDVRRAQGGEGQPPIQVNADTVIAGYNVLLNRGPCETGAAPVSPETSRLVAQWETPAEAAAFAVDVLGDTAIQTCQGCERVQGTPGKGLAFVQEDTRADVEMALQELVAGAAAPTTEELMAISAPPGILITRPLIEAIRADEERDLIVSRLAGEIALARTLERALLVRRMLQAGKREPNVASIGPAQDALETSLIDLTAEIDGLLYELDVRRSHHEQHAQKLLVRKQQRDLAAPQETLLPPEPPFAEGAIRR